MPSMTPNDAAIKSLVSDRGRELWDTDVDFIRFLFLELDFSFGTTNAYTSRSDRNPNVSRRACSSNFACKRGHNEPAKPRVTKQGLVSPEGHHLAAKRLVSLLPVYK